MHPRALHLLALAALSAPLHAEVLKVPQHFPTIQAAVDAALPGDHVVVSKGSYSGPLVVAGKQSLVVRGKGRPVLKGTPGAPVVTLVDCQDVALVGFAIRGGSSGVAVLGGAAVSVERCRVALCDGDGLVAAGTADLELLENRVRDTGSRGMALVPGADGTPCEGFVVARNRIVRSGATAVAVSGNDGLVLANRARGGASAGFSTGLVGASLNVLFESNRAAGVAGDAYHAAGAGHVLLANLARKAGGNGIVLTGAQQSAVDNRVRKVKGVGLTAAVEQVSLVGNRVRKAGGDGLQLEAAGWCQDNDVRGSLANGVEVFGPGSAFVGNVAKNSGSLDLLDHAGPGANVYKQNEFGSSNL